MGDVPVATLRPSGSTIATYYVHTDQVNTPRLVTRPSDNAIVWRWDTDPFGTVAPNQNPASLGTFIYNLRFPGQYYQVETGLNYNYERDYDPAVGRYIESDPIGLAGGSYSPYNYAYGDPVGNVDPLGLAPPLPPGVFPPPPNVPGGPWSWAPNAQNPRGGVFISPKPPKGPRTTCTYTPPGPEHPDPYWKVTSPNGAEQRYNQFGEPVTPGQAHPGPRISLSDNPWLFFLYSLVHSDPVY
jgi:RHS repeat-associated protein